MRAVVQRVSRSQVEVEGEVIGEIGAGLMVLLGVEQGDTDDDAVYLADKVVGLRVFEDPAGKMNLNVSDVGGALLVVSQFTLLGDVRKGKRPSFVQAADPESGNQLYERFVSLVRDKGLEVNTGKFRSMMNLSLVNQGPVTILLDSRKVF